MDKHRIFYTLFYLLFCLLLLCGCARQEVADTPLIVSFPPAPTPGPTTHTPAPPDASPSPAAIAFSANTPVITNAPSVLPSPTNPPAPDKTEIAEGFYYVKLDDALKKRITGMSFPTEKDAKITYADLRYICLLHYDFEGAVKIGELIVHKKVANEVTQIFYALYQAKYPFTSIRLVDDYGEPGDDNKSMAANNTSAFNYRRVTGSKTLSRHSYGAAIDINPRLNPYITGDRIAPENGREYADRSKDFLGKITHDDLCYRLFHDAGWIWGGDFSGDKDYQHFSKDIGFN